MVDIKNLLTQVIDKEIEQCKGKDVKPFAAQYASGFINGLIQAKYLIEEALKVARKNA